MSSFLFELQDKPPSPLAYMIHMAQKVMQCFPISLVCKVGRLNITAFHKHHESMLHLPSQYSTIITGETKKSPTAVRSTIYRPFGGSFALSWGERTEFLAYPRYVIAKGAWHNHRSLSWAGWEKFITHLVTWHIMRNLGALWDWALVIGRTIWLEGPKNILPYCVQWILKLGAIEEILDGWEFCWQAWTCGHSFVYKPDKWWLLSQWVVIRSCNEIHTALMMGVIGC